MQRRLYFLFPNEVHAQDAINRLQSEAGVEAADIPVITDFEPRLLTHPHSRRGIDVEALLESWLWNANLALFFLALAGFVAAPALYFPFVAGIAVVIVFATFICGLMFTKRIPSAYRIQFHEALAHGEIMLMLDRPSRGVRKIEHFVHTHYPDAVTGGVGWHLKHLKAIGH